MLLALPLDIIKEIIGYVIKLEDIYNLIKTDNSKIVQAVYEGVKQLGKSDYINYNKTRKIQTHGLRKLINIEYIYYDVIANEKEIKDIYQLKKIKDIVINLEYDCRDQDNFLAVVKRFIDDYNTDINHKNITINMDIYRNTKRIDRYEWKWSNKKRDLHILSYDVGLEKLDQVGIKELIEIFKSCRKYGKIEGIYLDDILKLPDLMQYINEITELKTIFTDKISNINLIIDKVEIIEESFKPICNGIMNKEKIQSLKSSDKIKVFNIPIFLEDVNSILEKFPNVQEITILGTSRDKIVSKYGANENRNMVVITSLVKMDLLLKQEHYEQLDSIKQLEKIDVLTYSHMLPKNKKYKLIDIDGYVPCYCTNYYKS